MKREDELFEQVLALTSAEAREAYLLETCGEDHDLRRRIEELLVAHIKPGRTWNSLESRVGPEQAPDTERSEFGRGLSGGACGRFKPGHFCLSLRILSASCRPGS
jgi:hypothetical protein